MPKLEDNLRTLAENLLTLEVNTILKPSITAEKMPPPEHALVDLAAEYDQALRDLGVPRTADDLPEPAGSPFEFERLRTRAGEVARALEKERTARALTDEEHDKLLLLWRIHDYGDQLMGMLHGYERRAGATIPRNQDHISAREHPIELLPDELVLLRKIWDIGLERIVFQTVIQLDGDVINRIQSGFAEPTARNQRLLEIHNHAVATSIGFWKELVELLGSFLRGITDLVRGK